MKKSESNKQYIKSGKFLIYLSILQLIVFSCVVAMKVNIIYANFLFDLFVSLFALSLFPIFFVIHLKSGGFSINRMFNLFSVFIASLYSVGLIFYRFNAIEKNILLIALAILVIQFSRHLGALIKDFDLKKNKIMLISSMLFLSVIAFL
jgi:hypothetical protein